MEKDGDVSGSHVMTFYTGTSNTEINEILNLPDLDDDWTNSGKKAARSKYSRCNCSCHDSNFIIQMLCTVESGV